MGWDGILMLWRAQRFYGGLGGTLEAGSSLAQRGKMAKHNIIKARASATLTEK